MLGLVNPFTNRARPPAARELNATSPPWAYTYTRPGAVSPHPVQHVVVGHPNAAHTPREQATPFVEGAGAAAGQRAAAQVHAPRFAGGRRILNPGVRR